VHVVHEVSEVVGSTVATLPRRQLGPRTELAVRRRPDPSGVAPRRVVDSARRLRDDPVIMMIQLGPRREVVRDRRTPVPLYVQLREALRRDIRERGLAPGDRLPTETQLGERYGVSRATIRQAVGDLELEGVLRRVQGKGTFVATPKIQHVPVLTSFSELLRSQGYEPSHRLLESSIVGAPVDVAGGLGIDEGEPCRYLWRLFAADGEPVGVSQTWLPLAVIGDEVDRWIERGAANDRSLYELLEEGADEPVLHRATETINPCPADPAVAELLDCPRQTPLLLIHRATFTAADRPLEWTRLMFVPGRYEYRVELRRPDEAST
jgi:GntR family transcriptional regulator